jgi:hypothetical protein
MQSVGRCPNPYEFPIGPFNISPSAMPQATVCQQWLTVAALSLICIDDGLRRSPRLPAGSRRTRPDRTGEHPPPSPSMQSPPLRSAPTVARALLRQPPCARHLVTPALSAVVPRAAANRRRMDGCMDTDVRSGRRIDELRPLVKAGNWTRSSSDQLVQPP